MESSNRVTLRKCVSCGKRDIKSKFIRLVRKPLKHEELGKRSVCVDFNLSSDGRGAYICKNLECVSKAKKGRRIERSLSCRVGEEIYKTIEGAVLKEDG